MVRLTIQIADFVQSFEVPTPGAIKLPTCIPPQVYNPVTGRCEVPITTIPGQPPQQVSPPTITATVVNISTLTNAFKTQNIPILVSAVCTNPPAPINGVDATLFIDGQSVAVPTVRNGIAQFYYVFKDPGLHTIRVTIPKSTNCGGDGSASIQVDVSSEIPSTLERLRIEEQARTAAEQQIEAIRQQTRQLLSSQNIRLGI